jgi:hypothetical protein
VGSLEGLRERGCDFRRGKGGVLGSKCMEERSWCGEGGILAGYDRRSMGSGNPVVWGSRNLQI